MPIYSSIPEEGGEMIIMCFHKAVFIIVILISIVLSCAHADPIQGNIDVPLVLDLGKGANQDNVCCIADEWEALMYLDYGTVFIDQNTAFAYINGSVHAAYSFKQKKVFYNVTGVELSPLIPKPQPANTLLLYDFDKGIGYMVTGDDCQKNELDEKMTRYCIPREADELTRGFIGSGNDTRPLYTYQFTTNIDIPWEITASVFINESTLPMQGAECDPVYVSYFSPSVNPDSGSLYNLQVLDRGPLQTAGIFDIPQQCR